MIGVIVGGLFVTAVFLYPALQLKKRNKWPPLMGILMFLAGIGMVGVAASLAKLAVDNTTAVLVVGGIALVLLGGLAIATAADLSDKKLDYPWSLFLLPSLAAVVIITSGPAFDYLSKQVEKNTKTLTSQVETR